MIDISVIIPTYNRLWALPQAVESCRHSICGTEIIVVDDGSTDGTWEWLATQPDVVAIRQDSWGKDWAVNKGLAAAQGEYIRFLDSDDWLMPGANDGQLEVARSTGAEVVVAGCQVVDEVSKVTTTMPWVNCDDFVAQQLGECSGSHYSAYLFKRSFVAQIPHRQEFGAKDDRMYVLELALRNPRVSVFDTPTLAHRYHARQRLQSVQGMDAVENNLHHMRIYRKVLAMLQNRGELTLRRKRAAIRVIWPLAHWIGYTHLDEADEIARWVHELDPEFQPPEDGALGWFYRNLGFRRTERILRVRRRVVDLVKLLRP